MGRGSFLENNKRQKTVNSFKTEFIDFRSKKVLFEAESKIDAKMNDTVVINGAEFKVLSNASMDVSRSRERTRLKTVDGVSSHNQDRVSLTTISYKLGQEEDRKDIARSRDPVKTIILEDNLG